MDYRYLLIILLLIPMSTAVELESGQTHNIFNGTSCYGEAQLKIIGQEKEVSRKLVVNNWTKIDNNNWRYQCDGSPINISFYVPRKTKNTYEFRIHYQPKDLEYTPINVTQGPTYEQQEYQSYLIDRKIGNIQMIPQGFVIDADLSIDMKNTVLFSILLFVMVSTFLIFKYKKRLLSTNENNDVLSYSNKKDEDIDDILNQIK